MDQSQTIPKSRWHHWLALPGRVLRPRLVTAVMAIVLVAEFCQLVGGKLSYDNTWSVGEWLINYQGGFVRRGLPGEIIFQLASHASLPPLMPVQWLSLGSYIALAALLVHCCRRHCAPALLLSSMALAAPLFSGFIFRKECTGLSLLAIALMLLQQTSSSRRAQILRWLAVNGLASIAILSHESFGFYGLGALLLHQGLVHQSSQGEAPNIVAAIRRSRALLYLLPALIAFLITLASKGSSSIALAIHQSWATHGNLLGPSQQLVSAAPGGAMEAIGWSTLHGIQFQLIVLREVTHGIFWSPAAWLLTIYLCSLLLIAFSMPANGIQSAANLFRLCMLWQLIATAPLYILGWDYGRWIFLWAISTLLCFCLAAERTTNAGMIQQSIPASITRLFPVLPLKPLRAHWILLVFGVPMCCWSGHGFLISTPAFHLLRLLR